MKGRPDRAVLLQKRVSRGKKIRKTICASISLKFVSEHYLFCLSTVKSRMGGREIIELVGDI